MAPSPEPTAAAPAGRGRRAALLLWLPLVVWLAIIFYLSAQPDLPHPENDALKLALSSAAHVGVFGVLAVLWARALPGGRRVWLAALILTALYGLSDELHQAFVPGRTPDPWDVACDVAGGLLALGIWCRLPARWRGILVP